MWARYIVALGALLGIITGALLHREAEPSFAGYT
jgi:hypothetical protein